MYWNKYERGSNFSISIIIVKIERLYFRASWIWSKILIGLWEDFICSPWACPRQYAWFSANYVLKTSLFLLIPSIQSWCMGWDVPCALAGLGTVGDRCPTYLTAISKWKSGRGGCKKYEITFLMLFSTASVITFSSSVKGKNCLIKHPVGETEFQESGRPSVMMFHCLGL